MKKLLISLITLLTFAPVFAAEVIVISDKSITAIKSKNPEVAKASIIHTVDNERKMIMLDIKKTGSANIVVNINGKDEYIEVKSLQTRYEISLPEGLSEFELDELEELIEILPPPNPERFPDILRGRM